MTTKRVTVHVRENNAATLICPACGMVKHVVADKFQDNRHTVSVRCHCQHVFNVLLDFRRYFRKQISLSGTYIITSEGGVGGGVIHINNISRGGLGFTISGLHRIEEGQEMLLEFQLNDRKKTILKKPAVVRSVRQNAVGCQFKDNAELDRDLGFFLQS